METVHVLYIDGRIAGCHKKKKILKKYLKRYKKSHKIVTYKIVIGDKKDCYYGYELVSVEHGYVQRMYEDAYAVFHDEHLSEITTLISNLQQMYIGEGKLKKKKVIFNGLLALEKIRNDMASYVYSLSELEQYKQMLEEYQYHTYW